MSSAVLVISLGAFQTAAMLIGGVVVSFKKKFTREYLGFILSMASSLMLGIAFFELLTEALEKLYNSPSRGTHWVTPLAFMSGVIIVSAVDNILPHWHHHQSKISRRHPQQQKNGWTLLFGFVIHDFPEGICIGAGYAMNPSFGLLVGLSMFLSNVAEGMTISIQFEQQTRLKDLLVKVSIPGLVVLAGSVLGFYFCHSFTEIHYAIALALAAGAIVFVTLDELVPEAYASKSQTQILWGFISGFGLICLLSAL